MVVRSRQITCWSGALVGGILLLHGICEGRRSVTYCCDPNAHCRCRREVCQGVSCQPGIDQDSRMFTCRGSRHNSQGIEECVKTDAAGSACNRQPAWLESPCTVDLWQGDTCEGDPAREDYPWMANDCM